MFGLGFIPLDSHAAWESVGNSLNITTNGINERISMSGNASSVCVVWRENSHYYAKRYNGTAWEQLGNNAGIVSDIAPNSNCSAVVAQEISNVQGAHLALHYGDIAYHLIIDYAGRVWEGRSLAYEGAHTLNANEGNIGVMLLGNFEKQDPSAAQLATQANLVALLRHQYRIRASRVYGHRDLSPTICPGGRLYPYVAQLRQA